MNFFLIIKQFLNNFYQTISINLVIIFIVCFYFQEGMDITIHRLHKVCKLYLSKNGDSLDFSRCEKNSASYTFQDCKRYHRFQSHNKAIISHTAARIRLEREDGRDGDKAEVQVGSIARQIQMTLIYFALLPFTLMSPKWTRRALLTSERLFPVPAHVNSC